MNDAMPFIVPGLTARNPDRQNGAWLCFGFSSRPRPAFAAAASIVSSVILLGAIGLTPETSADSGFLHPAT
ncbi:hypothetical protein BO71DRAFT_432970 [Aspergillus ellipticus CBS 707.79]|uniref:Uncharacterized protein n=1 Tax=Aspergillus ellipticus CBS 707.79 TaxID=1448320 RepID=A0A319D1G5_9EURO|nr:hypothetical protein BO71DRAFT_432970 [Aspergillus ellipticus CBS 707.79]